MVNRVVCPASASRVLPSQARTAKSRGPYPATSFSRKPKLARTAGSAPGDMTVDMMADSMDGLAEGSRLLGGPGSAGQGEVTGRQHRLVHPFVENGEHAVRCRVV